MHKFKFTKEEKISLFLAFLVLLGLFVSSSMTYRQQAMKPAFINGHFSWLEKIVGGWNIYYGGRWHNADLDGGQAGMTQFVMRKMAHFASYFLLGLFTYLGLRRIFQIKKLAPLLTWLIVVALASFDEYHQFLTGDRTPSINDVMLDSAGALFAILLAVIFFYLRKKKRDNRQ